MAGTPPITSPAPNAGDTSATTKSPEASQDQSGANKSDLETALSHKLYERFTISLSDMQVILGRNVFGLLYCHLNKHVFLHDVEICTWSKFLIIIISVTIFFSVKPRSSLKIRDRICIQK